MEQRDVILVIAAVVVLILVLIFFIYFYLRDKKNQPILEDKVKKEIDNISHKLSRDISLEILENTNKNMKREFDDMRSQIKTFDNRINAMSNTTEKRLEDINVTVDKNLKDSFKNVSDQLQKVENRVGQMHSLAKNVDDLKSIMSNTKSRGIIGEYQLDALISDMLSPNQYKKEFKIHPDSNDRVEFAIKLPSDNDSAVYLPVDAKFPADSYSYVLDARNSGDKQQLKIANNQLISRIKQEGQDVARKYINPPHTTPYAIIFLPSEGLFAECINLNINEELQKKFNVTIAGPSTMGVIINSIQMMYKTVAIQKQSSEVWNILRLIKSEFKNFEGELIRAQKQIQSAEATVSKLLTTRTNQMNKKLRSIETVDEGL